MENNTKRYWSCIIGPIEKNKIPFGGDFPMRDAVKNRFFEMFKEDADICSSGWGLTEEMKTRLNIISHLSITSPETLQQIDKILKTRLTY